MPTRTIRANELTSEQLERWLLLRRANPALDAPQFHPQFMLAVEEVCGDVEVAVMEENGQTVGFLPFQRDNRNVGRPIGGSLSDLQGVIVDPMHRWDAEQLIRGAGLVSWNFDHLIASQTPFQRWHAFVDDSPYLDLGHGYDAYCSERQAAGSSIISQANRKSRKIARDLGPIRFVWHCGDAAVLQQLIRWKQSRLKRSGFRDLFCDPQVVSLLEHITNLTADGFQGVLSAMYAGDRLLAAHLGMRSGSVLSSWIPAYDLELSHYSPGLVLHTELAKQAAENGVTRLDLGRGGNQLKRRLMSGAVPVAVGSVELRPLKRVLNTGWGCARSLVYATPLCRSPLRLYRRIRNVLVKP